MVKILFCLVTENVYGTDCTVVCLFTKGTIKRSDILIVIAGLSVHVLQHTTGHTPPLHCTATTPVCNYCGKTYSNNANLKKHLKIHTCVKRYECDVCGKMFHQKPNLMAHRIVHTGEKPFKCDLCNKTFQRSNQLKNHVASHKQFYKKNTAQQ